MPPGAPGGRINQFRGKEQGITFKVLNPTPPLHLTRVHPQDRAGGQVHAAEVDFVERAAVGDPQHEFEAKALSTLKLLGAPAGSNGGDIGDFDQASARLGVESNVPDGSCPVFTRGCPEFTAMKLLHLRSLSRINKGDTSPRRNRD